MGLNVNKYVKYDIETGVQYIKCGVMNILNSLLQDDTLLEFTCSKYVPVNLILDCAKELDLKVDDVTKVIQIPNSKSCIYVTQHEKETIFIKYTTNKGEH